jgi:hypothetical protein
MQQITLTIESDTYEALSRMARLRSLPLHEIASKILRDECAAVTVIEFPCKFPGVKRSRGR